VLLIQGYAGAASLQERLKARLFSSVVRSLAAFNDGGASSRWQCFMLLVFPGPRPPLSQGSAAAREEIQRFTSPPSQKPRQHFLGGGLAAALLFLFASLLLMVVVGNG